MQRELVNSSSIKSIGYDPSGVLEIEFGQGLVYQYSNVPEEVYENMFKSESLGSYFAQYIKKVFPFKLINPKKDI